MHTWFESLVNALTHPVNSNLAFEAYPDPRIPVRDTDHVLSRCSHLSCTLIWGWVDSRSTVE
jgi:hypothetical protein